MHGDCHAVLHTLYGLYKNSIYLKQKSSSMLLQCKHAVAFISSGQMHFAWMTLVAEHRDSTPKAKHRHAPDAIGK